MLGNLEEIGTSQERVSNVAAALAQRHTRSGEGRSDQFLVRMNKTILSLVEAAKPDKQSMVEYLKEAAVTVALQRLEASQK